MSRKIHSKIVQIVQLSRVCKLVEKEGFSLQDQKGDLEKCSQIHEFRKMTFFRKLTHVSGQSNVKG